MKSVNRVTLLGNVGKDPEVKHTSGGAVFARLSLATNERYKDKSGEWVDKTEWHNLVFWQKLAEIVGEYVKKGSKIYVEGKLQTRSYEKDGETKYSTEIVSNELVMLDGKDSKDRDKEQSSSSNRTATAKAAPKAQQPIDDDDIPF